MRELILTLIAGAVGDLPAGLLEKQSLVSQQVLLL